MDAYEKLIPVGEQISYFLYIEVAPANIDVNIHPTKTEIKFENEQAIWQIISAAVKESLGKFNAIPTIDFDTADMPDIPAFEQSNAFVQPQIHYNSDFNPFKNNTDGSSSNTHTHYSRMSSPSTDWENLYGGVGRASKMNQEASPDIEEELIETTFEAPVASTLYAEETMVEKSTQHLQLKGRFILTSVKSGLMLIDQHRAHIRVLFDRYMAQISRKQGVSQGMLFPEMLQLPPSEVAVLESINDELTALGFDVTNLGGGSFAINAIPEGVEGLNPVELIHNMVHTAQEKGGDVCEEVQTILALTLAQASAIVYGQVLTNAEMSNLVDSLFACLSPNYTPDGKIVLYTLREEEIEKLFK